MPEHDTEQSAYRFNESLILLGDSLNDAQYAANRYHQTGYDHKQEDALEHLRDLRNLADEVLERYDDTGGDQS